jgi:autotransporter-associated beta strand protein
MQLEALERRLALSLNDSLPPTAASDALPSEMSEAETLLLYLVNRTRRFPQDWASRLSIGLGSDQVGPFAPLVANEALLQAARLHSQEMLSRQTLSHSGADGSAPGDRAVRAGYPTTSVGENVGYDWNYPSYTANAIATRMNDGWFTSSGHRANMLTAGWTEFGGSFAVRQPPTGTQYATELFGKHDAGPFLSGVAFGDGNTDNQFDAGEGVGGVTITATGPTGTFTTTSLAAGAWAVKVPAGKYIVTASGGAWSGTSTVALTVGAANVAVDFIRGQATGWIDFAKYVNRAPVLAASGGENVSPSLIGSVPSGTTAGSLLGSSFSDLDPLASSGIAITAATAGTASGVWQYSIDAGANWLALGTPSAGSSRLLRQQDLVRFVPTAGSQPGTASLTYRGWDQTFGSAGATSDTSTNGSGSAFSTTTANATAATIGVNAAPVLTPAASGTFDPVSEDATSPAGSTVATIIGTSFSDANPGTAAGIALVGVTGTTYGAWSYSTDAGTSWTAVGIASESSALLLRASDRLRFVPTANYSGSASVSFRGWDQSSGAAGTRVDVSSSSAVGGSTAYSIDTASSTITVSPINDAPVFLDGRSSLRLKPIAANSSFNFIGTTVADILGNCVSDPDVSPLTGIALIGLGGGGTFYWSTNNGSSWSGGSVSPTFVTLLRSTDRIGFAPNSGFNGDATLSFRLWDRTTGTAGFNQANLSNPGASTGGTTAFGADILTARIFVGTAGAAPIASFGTAVRSAGGRTVDSIAITFSKSISGLDPDDFTLTRDGNGVSLSSATITGSGSSYVLGGLSEATTRGGSYSIALKTTQTGIADSAGTSVSGATSTSFTVAPGSPPSDVVLSKSTVAENAPTQTLVGTLSTTDSDIGDTFSYALVTGAGDTDNALFAISGDQLLSKATFDYETRNSFSIRVRTVDSSGLTFEEPLAVSVTDVLDDYEVVVGTGSSANAPSLPAGSLTRLVKRGPGVLVISSASSHGGGTILEEGTIRLSHAGGLGSGGVTVRQGGSLVIADEVTEVHVATLDVQPGGRIDIGTSRMIVGTGLTHASLVERLAAARGDGMWDGAHGITSSAAASARLESQSRSIGWMDHGDGSFVIAFVAPGDTNLDDRVDILDVANMFAGNKFNTSSPATWTDGDFDFDGLVDVLDAAGFLSADLFDRGSYLRAAAVTGSDAAGMAQKSAVLQQVFAFIGDQPPAESSRSRARMIR